MKTVEEAVDEDWEGMIVGGITAMAQRFDGLGRRCNHLGAVANLLEANVLRVARSHKNLGERRCGYRQVHQLLVREVTAFLLTFSKR